MKKTLALLLLLSSTGCSILTSKPKGDLVHFSLTTIGMDISQTPESPTPHLRLGYVRMQGDIIPTGTNNYAPAVRSELVFKPGFNGFVNDTFETGGATRLTSTNR